MMDMSNGWFESINYPSIDPQQQTYVTKHDLELLHKKIIATDLIVQKYQDANRALLRLQSENDDLKQQVEQITNECCIFGKQVTECTQECDNLKDQIGVLNGEKRELHDQLRLLQDENTNNYHEIMVLKQYESLKEVNDQLTKTVDRQQKQLAKLQLQLQRQSPVVYKPNRDKSEPSETDIALINSQKSVRELRLTLGRLMNFIQISKIEIPTALHIRPVLKAHEINDDFLEREGEFIYRPVKKVSKPVISRVLDEDDDDDDNNNGDFIDVTDTVHAPPVNTTNPSVNVTKEMPTTSKSSSRQEQKRKEVAKTKTTKKSSVKTRRQTEKSISESSTTKLDDLASQLELALSQPNQQELTSQISSFLSDDDDDEDKTLKSDKQQMPVPVYTPVILQPPVIHRTTNSTITFTPKSPQTIPKDISFFSDDDNDEMPPQKLPSISYFIQPQPVSTHEQTNSSLQVDSITPMEYETTDKPTTHMSFLSEDDDDNRSLSSVSTPITAQQSGNQEYISPLESNFNEENNDNYDPQSSDKHSSVPSPTPILTTDVTQESLSTPEESLPEKPVENVQEPLSDENDQTTVVIPVNTLNSNHCQIVLRLLHVLTQVPTPLKPLRLVRRRTQRKKIPHKPATKSVEEKSEDRIQDSTIIHSSEHPVSEPMEESRTIIDDTTENQVFTLLEERTKLTEENDENISETLPDQVSVATEDHSELTEKNQSTVDATPVQIIEETTAMDESNTTIEERPDHSFSKPAEEQLQSVEAKHTTVTEIPEEQPKSVEKISTTIPDILDNSLSIPIVEQSESTEDKNRTINETPEVQVAIPKKAQLKTIEPRHSVTKIDKTISKVNEKRTSIQRNRRTEQLTILPASSTISTPPQFKRPFPPPALDTPKQSLLQPFQKTIVFRLLNTLTNLPVKPVRFLLPLSSRKRKGQVVVPKPSAVLSPQRSSRIPPAPTRMQTRSFNSIRTCIARCNQPKATTRKRTATEVISSPPKAVKRMKSTTIEQPNNDYDLVKKFINSFSKDINDELSKMIERKLQDDISLFNDNIYPVISDCMIEKCDIILSFVKRLHPYEESIQILLTYIHSKSSIFQQHFIAKLNRAFEYEIKQQQISPRRLKIFNRLFFLSCSIFVLPSTVTIYARLFDIGYHLSHDILLNALSFISSNCSSLTSVDSQTHSSNVLLHQVLFDLSQEKKLNLTFEYLENLLIAYHRYTHDQEDLIRSFVIISRSQTWLWCSSDLCTRFFFPLLNQINGQDQQRQIILIILQYVLYLYKDNEDFKRDIHFHEQIKQLLSSLKIMNSRECTVRDQILFIVHTCCSINK